MSNCGCERTRHRSPRCPERRDESITCRCLRRCRHNPNVSTAQEALRLFATGSIPQLLTLLCPDATITVQTSVASIPFGGTWTGLDPANPRSIPAFFATFAASNVPLTPIRVLPNFEVSCDFTEVVQRFVINERYRCPTTGALSEPVSNTDVVLARFAPSGCIQSIDIWFDAGPAALFFATCPAPTTAA